MSRNPRTIPERTKNAFKTSFSGADIKVYFYYPYGSSSLKNKPSLLPSVHTLSISVHEAKSHARALGFRGVKGIARGVRTIAGSLILTVIDGNPLGDLAGMYLEGHGWSIDKDTNGIGSVLENRTFTNKIAPLIPPFNLIVHCVAETNNWITPGPNDTNEVYSPISIKGAGCLLQGVEFIDEGITFSVNDVVTEVTLSFIALDYKPLSNNEFTERILFLDQPHYADQDLLMRKLKGEEKTSSYVQESLP
jgi:hypothetical protein